jgi:hypothetical protein
MRAIIRKRLGPARDEAISGGQSNFVVREGADYRVRQASKLFCGSIDRISLSIIQLLWA